MRKRIIYYFFILVACVMYFNIDVNAADSITLKSKFTSGHLVKLIIESSGTDVEDGYNIYRSTGGQSAYTYIDDVIIGDYDYDDDGSDSNSSTQGTITSYIDDSVLTAYTTYYYKVEAFKYKTNSKGKKTSTKDILFSGVISVLYPGYGPTITTGKRTGKNGSTLSWQNVSGADGYMVYCLTDMDEKGNMIWPDIDNESLYKLVATKSGNSNTSATFKKLTNGVTYYYRIYAYRTIDGQKVISFASDYKEIAMDYYAYAGESYEQKIKRAFGSEKNMKKNFKTAKKAKKQMKTIKIKVWDYKKGKKGKKITKTKKLTVNKRLAPTIKQIFNEIYKSKEKQVIKDIGCYSYRKGEHMYGLAIDVNPNENYMIDGKKVMAGSYWKPKKDPYSIPNDSEFVRIMNRYGFYRGDWGKRKDYMHFSYFGT